MDLTLQERVRARAEGLCEYCRIPEGYVRLPFQVDHIIAEQHGGKATLSNLAWSCLPCNKRKGPNIAGVCYKTRKLVPLFNPRRHKWSRHFAYQGPFLVGLTPIGRATVSVLAINEPYYVSVRQGLFEEGLFPEV